MQAKFINVLPKEERNEVDMLMLPNTQSTANGFLRRNVMHHTTINTIDCSQMIIKSGYFTLHIHITHYYVVR